MKITELDINLFEKIPIISIESGGRNAVYDIEIDTVHAFNAKNNDSGTESISHNSAMIALFNLDDADMLTCKFGTWYETDPHRARANNSAVILRHKIDKKTFLELWEKIKASGSGEPGFFFTNDKEFGLNPCLTGDTLISVADGRGYVPIKELANSGQDVPVFSLNENGILVSSIMRRPHLSGKNQAIYKIILDDGNIIRATENHKFPLQSGEIKELKNIVPGDSLRTMVKFNSILWDNKNSQKYTFIRSGGKTRAEHRIIAEQQYNISLMGNSDVLTVHHKDYNAANNFPSNLEVMTVKDHTDLHKIRMMGENNPIHKILKSDKALDYRKQLSEASSGNKNPNFCGVSNEELYNHALDLTKSIGRIASDADWKLYAKKNKLPQTFSKWRDNNFNGVRGFLTKAAIECGFKTFKNTDFRTIKKLYYYLSQGYDCFIDEKSNIVLFNKICEVSEEKFITKYPEASVKSEYARQHNAKLQWKSDRIALLNSIRSSHIDRKASVKEIQSKIYNDLKFKINREPLKKEWINECNNLNVSIEISRKSSPFRKYSDLKEYASTSNHKVVSIEFDGVEDVYNGTVDNHHNFFIGKFENNGKIISINTMNCAEISLRCNQFCNLTTINATDVVDQEDLNSRSKAASFIGTLQAGYTNFHYLRDIWQKTTEKEALIGVSMTGIASGTILELDLEESAKIVVKENERVAKIIGINKAARCTTIKPEGSSSLVLGSSSGIHAWHDKRYIRRLRVGKNEAIYQYLELMHPELLEDEFFKPQTTSVISIPQQAPDDAITRDESALDLLGRVSRVYKDWVVPGHRKGANVNNVSTTVTIKPNEWEEVGEWMWQNKNNYTALSVLPHSEHSYIQPPFQTITKKVYDELVKSLHEVDLDNVVEGADETVLQDNVACSANNCEL